MDCAKVGQLILQLRKEKGLTQKQVAEQLKISNKTVSKWECGLGCPDVSLWEELSTLLGADVLQLLQGDLNPNYPDIGKIENVQFYACSTCGNILLSTGKANMSCCGRALHPLLPAQCTKEHEPAVEEVDTDYYCILNHEMSKEHYIAFVAYVHDDRVLLIRLYPEQSPEFRLPAMKGRGSLYLHCTKHGFQKCPLAL